VRKLLGCWRYCKGELPLEPGPARVRSLPRRALRLAETQGSVSFYGFTIKAPEFCVLGSFWGLSAPVHGQKADSGQSYLDWKLALLRLFRCDSIKRHI